MTPTNNVTLLGRLTKDIELRYTQSKKAVGTFGLAVDRRRKEDGADFINCVVWGGTAELMERTIKKGQRVLICGRLQTRNYEKDGMKRSVTEVIVEEFSYIEKRPENPMRELAPIDDEDESLPF